jgi:LuxR family maltose regulon positive regulatory protein
MFRDPYGGAVIDVSEPVLEGKVRVPRHTATTILPRPRITAMIEDSASRLRVTLVTGPAGAGKTVACQQWAATAPRTVAWLTADDGDRQPRRFWAGILAALRAAGVAADEPDTLLPAQSMAAIGQPADPVTLVIDDVHELTASPAEAELAFLLRQAPPTLSLVLCGRFAPTAGLARLRLCGELAEITGSDLACTPQETGALAGAGPAQPGRDRLRDHAQGWMAGVLLSLREDGPDAYLREQVLGPLAQNQQRFLLRTSVAPWLAADLAALLSGEHQAAAVLEELVAHNCLVEPAGHGYRYHPMLREMLRTDLARRFPGDVPGLLGQAARWYAARGDALEAAGCLAESGDWDGIAAALEEAGLAGALTTDLAALEALLRTCPNRMESPVIASVLAAARLAAGDRAGAADCLRQADPDDLSVAAIMVTLGADEAGGLAAGASPRTVAQRRSRGVLWYSLGCRLLGQDRFIQAGRAFEHAIGDLARLDLADRASGWLALCLALSGDLRGADSVLAHLPSGTGAAPIECLAQARIALEHDDLTSARALVQVLLAGDDAAGPGRAVPGEPDLTSLALAVTEAGAPIASDERASDGEATIRDRIAALLTAAVARRRHGEQQAAADLIEEALALAEPHGAIRVFLEGGPPVHAAISILVRPRSAGAGFAARILERFAVHVPGESGLPGQAPPLTDSELAVLRLLPSQLTYQEIAGEMFLSVNTVKTHLRLAYRKLGVNSRRAAVAQAHRLGLL